ncbi:MAG TPA: hypothetical protein VJ751_08720 [Pyrinomonadaceae bacterium]|nr:hypothetical protein [Pyrinomonadaceae bacterium]
MASMAEWVSAEGSGSMDEVILAQAAMLRGQMNLKQVKKEKKKKKN